MFKPEVVSACSARDTSTASQRLLKVLAVPLLVATVVGTVNARQDFSAENHHSSRPYAIGLWGDLPYSDEQAEGVWKMIDDMNAQRLAFSVHDGDLKAGGGECTDDVYYTALNYLNSLKAPAMFTPGDNDWTDCDRASAGGYNSLERLEFERQVLFSTPSSLGQHPMRQEVQADALCREPSLERRRRGLRHVECSGFLQQPVRRCPRSRRVHGTQRCQHRMDEEDLLRGQEA